jgi:uncharacterized protein (TIGR02421 family)
MTPATMHEPIVPAALDDELVDVVRARIASGKPVRRTLVGGGRLHVDRPLPFLCVYRPPPDREDPGTADLVRSQASYLIAPADPKHAIAVEAVIAGVVETLAKTVGACLVLELWAGEATGTPCFRIRTAAEDRLATTIDALAEALRGMASPVEVVSAADASPPDHGPVVDPRLAAKAGVLVIGLEVPPVYRSSRGIYPAVFRAFSRDLMHALQRGFFEFTRVQTPARPEHYQMLGRRRTVSAVRESDHALAELGASFDFLLAVTPVNTEAAWQEFCHSDRTCTPTLRYRMLEVDPELGKRKLYALPLERLEDPVLAQLLRDKRRELDRQLGLLEDRDTPRFLHGSLQLYGGVEDELFAEAMAILGSVRPVPRDGGPRCDAAGFAARVHAELVHYRAKYPALATAVSIRDDLTSVMVSHGDLMIPSRLDIAASRIEALVQHEIGTHVVTYANGRAQPLRVLGAGLANYEALQEGLAMFAEHLAGGLDGERLRLIAARVIAVRRLIEGASFPAVVAELVDDHSFAARTAFTIALRVFRGGGLTKDAIYLRGLVQILSHLHAGNTLDALLVGKIAFEQVALVEELLRRGILNPPRLRPRWLDNTHALARLARASSGLRVIDLMEAA